MNKLIIAVAGSGKTSHIIKEAHDDISNRYNIITTYTNENTNVISKMMNSYPKQNTNIKVKSWITLLLEYFIRPYQYIMADYLGKAKIGYILTEGKSGIKYMNRGNPVYYKESEVMGYYFNRSYKIYSDKISKYIVECNRISDGLIINRFDNIVNSLYIDEIQDMAGWDYELLRLLINSKVNVTMVGDIRQCTYLTNRSEKNKKYNGGGIREYIRDKIGESRVLIDENTLKSSHRNNKQICDYASKLFPEYERMIPCDCLGCRQYDADEHIGVFCIRYDNVEKYLKIYKETIILRWNKSKYPEINYGASKGNTFDRVLIYPTDKFRNYLYNDKIPESYEVRCKIYVAMTRARKSVTIVYEDKKYEQIREWNDMEL